MSNEHNIDKLLKESFDNFSPDAPDVWQAVQQGVQAAQASGAASSGAVTGAAVQGVSLTVKIVAGIAMAAASVTGYVLYNNQVNKDTVKAADPVVKEQIVSLPEVPAENNQPVKEDMITPLPQKNNTKTIKQPTSNLAKENPVSSAENKTGLSSGSVAENGAPVAETKNNEPNTTPDSKETAITEVPKSVTKVQADNVSKSDVSKPSTKPSTEKPYNPYADEGEVYEKPIIPGSISPNNDGLNDVFKIIIENESFYSLRILNEKAEIVFESKNSEQLWDGKHYKTGLPCPTGNYLYVLNYQYKGSETTHEASGLVRLFFSNY